MRKNYWTREEEDVVLRAVKDNPGNLKEAFEAASQMIDRTPKSITNRWYVSISKRTDKDSIALMCLSGKTYGINRKNCKNNNESSNTVKFNRLWKSLINFFGSKS